MKKENEIIDKRIAYFWRSSRNTYVSVLQYEFGEYIRIGVDNIFNRIHTNYHNIYRRNGFGLIQDEVIEVIYILYDFELNSRNVLFVIFSVWWQLFRLVSSSSKLLSTHRRWFEFQSLDESIPRSNWNQFYELPSKYKQIIDMANKLLLIASPQFQSLQLVQIELSLERILKKTIQRMLNN